MTESSALPRRGAVAIIHREQRLLTIRRSETVRAPGRFCFPGGGLEPGEEDEQALLRELAEELGVLVQPVRKLWQSCTPSGVDLAWWLADLPAAAVPTPNPQEVAAVFWLTVSELRAAPELLPTNHAFLDAWERGDFVIDGLRSPSPDL